MRAAEAIVCLSRNSKLDARSTDIITITNLFFISCFSLSKGVAI